MRTRALLSAAPLLVGIGASCGNAGPSGRAVVASDASSSSGPDSGSGPVIVPDSGSGTDSGSATGSGTDSGSGTEGGPTMPLPPVGDGSSGPVRGCGVSASPPPPNPNWNGPTLSQSLWTNISPPKVNLPTTTPPYGIPWVEIDPNDPATLYVAAGSQGMWKTTDGGRTWAQPGSPSQIGNNTQTGYIDNPACIRVDPGDSRHVYVTQGVSGTALGFWVSGDAGATWTKPAGFLAVGRSVADNAQAQDVTQLAVDPSDFCHIIASYHSGWRVAGGSSSGVIESLDGGNNWVAHLPPNNAWTAGSKGVHFLHDPVHGVGNANTWLVSDDNGFWRTTDAGAHWTQVWTSGSPHGGNQIYYATNGMLYAGAANHPIRSKDNGATWEALNGLSIAYYYTVYGDGATLYTQLSFTGTNGRGPQAFRTSPESDGLTWTPFNGGTQTFIDGPFVMRFDPVHRIMYSASWNAGLLALRVP